MPATFPPARTVAACAAALLVAGVAVWVARSFWGFSYDDAFITYRYSRNLVEHHELAYNLGEPVLGTTAPGYAVLLAALAALTPISIPGWGTLVGVAALVLAAWVLRKLLAPLVGRLAAPAAALFAVAALLARWNVELYGSEFLPLFALGLAGSTLLLVDGREIAAGALVGAAAVLRLDAALLLLLLSAAAWRSRRQAPWRFAVAAGAPLVAWLAWLRLEFGAVVPQTLAAKRGEQGLANAVHLAAQGRWFERSFGVAPLVALAILAVAGLLALRREGARPQARPAALAAAVVGLWIVLHELIYQLLGIPFAPWYHLYLVNALLALAAVGALGFGLRQAPRARTAWALAGAAVLVAPGAAFAWRQAGAPPDPRTRGYVEAAHRIAAASGARPTSVAAYEIGVLGYESGAGVLDLMGLVSPAARRARVDGRLTDWLLASSPCWIVDATVFPRRDFGVDFASPLLAARYELYGRVPDSRGGGFTLDLLRRRGENC